MKVLIIGDFCYPNYMGGSSKHVYDLITNFPKFDIETKLITRGRKTSNNYSADEKDAEVIYNEIKESGNIIELNSIGIFNPNKYWSAIKEADYIILEHPVMGLIGGLLSVIRGKKVIYHYHGPIHLEYELKAHKKGLRYNLLWLFQKLTVAISDKVLTHSDYMREVSRKEHSVPLSKSFHLPPYIETIQCNENLPYYNSPDKINLLIPRRLTARTGVVEFLTTFLKLDKSFRDKFHIYISGKGELKDRVEELVRKDPDNLSYIGFISYDELWTLYAKIDSVVVPTLDLEGFGYIILEAMSCGAGAIVSNSCGGGYEFVNKHLGPEYIFDVFSTSSVMNALETIEKNRDNRSHFEKIAAQFTIANMINSYKQILRD